MKRSDNHRTALAAVAAVLLASFLLGLLSGCPTVTVKEGDPLSVEHWDDAFERWVGDWSIVAGLEEPRELTEDDFNEEGYLVATTGVEAADGSVEEVDVTLDITWDDYSASRDGYKTFREYEADKVRAEEEDEADE